MAATGRGSVSGITHAETRRLAGARPVPGPRAAGITRTSAAAKHRPGLGSGVDGYQDSNCRSGGPACGRSQTSEAYVSTTTSGSQPLGLFRINAAEKALGRRAWSTSRSNERSSYPECLGTGMGMITWIRASMPEFRETVLRPASGGGLRMVIAANLTRSCSLRSPSGASCAAMFGPGDRLRSIRGRTAGKPPRARALYARRSTVVMRKRST